MSRHAGPLRWAAWIYLLGVGPVVVLLCAYLQAFNAWLSATPDGSPRHGVAAVLWLAALAAVLSVWSAAVFILTARARGRSRGPAGDDEPRASTRRGR